MTNESELPSGTDTAARFITYTGVCFLGPLHGRSVATRSPAIFKVPVGGCGNFEYRFMPTNGHYNGLWVPNNLTDAQVMGALIDLAIPTREVIRVKRETAYRLKSAKDRDQQYLWQPKAVLDQLDTFAGVQVEIVGD